MAEPKFTPGPWVRDRHGQRRGSNGEGVNVWDAGIGYASRSPETEANAHLIAAAPDMYAAIECFMPKGIAIGNGNVPDDLCVPMDVTMGELRAFEAALAKARGEPLPAPPSQALATTQGEKK